MSIAGGLHMALSRAAELGANAMQIFSHNPRGWAFAPISVEDAELFRRKRDELDIRPVFIHTSYLINIASPKEDLRVKSLNMLREELLRADVIGAEYVVMHTGVAHDEAGQDRTIKSIREALGDMETEAGLLIENTSGKKGDMASTVGDLARIMQGAGGAVKGVCIDTCHAYAAGYDLAVDEGLHRLAKEVKRYLGDDIVKLIHMNDSKGEHDSGTDRHEHLGKGNIGHEGLQNFVKHPVFKNVPVIIETPQKAPGEDKENLGVLQKMF